MPAKGQDMQTSIFLARLIGPFAFLIGIALLIHRAQFRTLAGEILASPALLFLTGLITFPAGLAIVLWAYQDRNRQGVHDKLARTLVVAT